MNLWHQAPFARLLLPLIAGIISASFARHVFLLSSPLVILSAGLFIALSFFTPLYSSYKYRWLYGVFLTAFFFLLGYKVTLQNTPNLKESHYSRIYMPGDLIIAELAEPVLVKEKSVKAVLRAKSILKNKKTYPVSGNILCYFFKDSLSMQLKYGNKLIFQAPLTVVPSPQNPSEFNYKRFLRFHGIYHQAYLKSHSYQLLDEAPNSDLTGFAFRIRDRLNGILKSHHLDGNEYGVASALLLGSREEIDNELVQAYASSGALHVLSVSGMHVGIIFIVMASMLAFLDKMKHGTIAKTVFLLLGLWFYALLTGLSPSVVRAATMFSFIVVGKAGKHNTNIYNILACSAFFLLLLNPFLLMEVGFQLSYLAVIGIVYIQPKLDRLWDAYIPAAGRAGNWIIAQVWAITTVSIAAQLATFSLGLLYFHQFPNYFMFSNLVVIPLSTLIIYCGVLLFVISPFETLAGYVAVVFKGAVSLLNDAVRWVEKLPFSLLDGISISVTETWLIYLMIACTIAFFILKEIKFVNYFLLVLIAFLTWQVQESFLQHRQKKIVVYNISKTSAIDFIDGTENFFLSDSSLAQDGNRLLFYVKHHWWELGLKKMIFLNSDTLQEVRKNNFFLKENFAQFYGKRIAFISPEFSSVRQRKKMAVDYVIVSDNPEFTVEKIKENFDFGLIILDASNTAYTSVKWRKDAQKNMVECYSVVERGAFVEEL